MKWLIPIGLAIAGAATAVVLAKRSSSPTLRAYAGAAPLDPDGTGIEEDDFPIATYSPTVEQTIAPVRASSAPIIPIATPHDRIAVTQNLAPSYRNVTWSSPVAPTWQPKEAQ